jgi:hypothetical protein
VILLPTKIVNLLQEILGVDYKENKPVKWKQINELMTIPHDQGVYIIALDEPISAPLFSDDAILEWLDCANKMTVDENVPDIDGIKRRLSAFWYSDETILYIGMTGNNRGINRRLHDFYNHKIGDFSPHRGGHWLKTLENLNNLNIYWSKVLTGNPQEIETKMLKYFMENVSENSKRDLYDNTLPLPFANIRFKYPGGYQDKDHGLDNQTIKRSNRR